MKRRAKPAIVQEQLAKQTYLTVPEAAVYLGAPSADALRKWARRYAVPKCRRGRVILFLRRDLDEAVGGNRKRNR